MGNIPSQRGFFSLLVMCLSFLKTNQQKLSKFGVQECTWISSQALSISPAVRWRTSLPSLSVPQPWWTKQTLLTYTDTHRHKCRVEALMMAVTDQQLGLVPALLWEMTLFGPIKVRLCVDTSIHMIITLWGIPSLCFSVYSLFLKPLWGHTQTHSNWPISCHLKSTFFMFEVSWISRCQPGKPL